MYLDLNYQPITNKCTKAVEVLHQRGENKRRVPAIQACNLTKTAIYPVYVAPTAWLIKMKIYLIDSKSIRWTHYFNFGFNSPNTE